MKEHRERYHLLDGKIFRAEIRLEKKESALSHAKFACILSEQTSAAETTSAAYAHKWALEAEVAAIKSLIVAISAEMATLHIVEAKTGGG